MEKDKKLFKSEDFDKHKKLFKSEDFDKHKKLFTSEDFDKHVESNDKTVGDKVETHSQEKIATESTSTVKPNWQKIAVGLVVVAVVVLGCIFIMPESTTEMSEEKPLAEVAGTSNSEILNSNDSVSENNEGSSSDVQNDVASAETTTKSAEVKGTESGISNQTETVEPQKVNVNVAVEGSIETLANEVIAGKFANWPEREQKLGKRYKEVQSKVNEMYRKGLVK